jgi:hypothetical protein
MVNLHTRHCRIADYFAPYWLHGSGADSVVGILAPLHAGDVAGKVFAAAMFA